MMPFVPAQVRRHLLSFLFLFCFLFRSTLKIILYSSGVAALLWLRPHVDDKLTFEQVVCLAPSEIARWVAVGVAGLVSGVRCLNNRILLFLLLCCIVIICILRFYCATIAVFALPVSGFESRCVVVNSDARCYRSLLD